MEREVSCTVRTITKEYDDQGAPTGVDSVTYRVLTLEEMVTAVEKVGIDIGSPFTLRVDTVRDVWLVSQ